MGTSAGALAGSLYAAGYSPREVAQQLSRDPPIQLLRPSLAPWRGGVLSLDGVIDRLRELLPATFEELQQEFAVGVVDSSGRHVLIDSGPLPEAVAASAAIPVVFSNVQLPGRSQGLKDGGVVDRIGLRAWRDRRRRQLAAGAATNGSDVPPHSWRVAGGSKGAPPRLTRVPQCLVHVIERSSPFSGVDDVLATAEREIHIVRSPKSGVNFFDLGDFERQFEAARSRARPVVEAAGTHSLTAPPRLVAKPAGGSSGSGAAAASKALPAAPSTVVRSRGGGGLAVQRMAKEMGS